MTMRYGAGQALGLLSTVCCLAMPLFREKKRMLWANGANNLLVIGNILLLAGFGSGVMVSAVAVVQVIAALRQLRQDRRAEAWEKGLFLGLYVSCGLLGLRSAVDLLPVIGAVFNMLATFQRDEQRTRWLLLVNASIFAAYYVLIGSTALLSVLCTMASTALGLYCGRGCGAA